jgi:hypothetical protein
MKRKPTALHRAIVRQVCDDAQYGNATHINTLIAKLKAAYGTPTVKFAVQGLTDGRVGAVMGLSIRHVGRGFYELIDVTAH